MTIFTVNFFLNGAMISNLKKEDLQLFMETPGAEPKVSVQLSSNGTAYFIGLTPTRAGQYWFDFVLRGMIGPVPFLLPVKSKQGKVPPEPAYEGRARKH